MKHLIWLILLSSAFGQIGLPFPGPGAAAVSTTTTLARQAAKGTNSSATSLAVALGSNELAGSTLIGVCGHWASSVVTSLTATDTRGNTWTAVGNTADNVTLFDSSLWVIKALNVAAGANTVTFQINGAGAGHLDCGLLEYASPIGTVATSNFPASSNNSAVAQTPSVTTSQTNTIVLCGFVAGITGVTYTGTSGYTSELVGTGGSGNSFNIWDQASVSSGTTTVTLTGSSSSNGPFHSCMVAVH